MIHKGNKPEEIRSGVNDNNKGFKASMENDLDKHNYTSTSVSMMDVSTASAERLFSTPAKTTRFNKKLPTFPTSPILNETRSPSATMKHGSIDVSKITSAAQHHQRKETAGFTINVAKRNTATFSSLPDLSARNYPAAVGAQKIQSEVQKANFLKSKQRLGKTKFV